MEFKPEIKRFLYLQNPDMDGFFTISGTLGHSVKESFQRHLSDKTKSNVVKFQPSYDKACSYIEDKDLKDLPEVHKQSTKILKDSYKAELRKTVAVFSRIITEKCKSGSLGVCVRVCRV